MNWLGLLQAIFALTFVIGLILALAYVLKRYAPQLLAKMQSSRGEARLEIVETLVLDPARRLVLVRLDNEERLILLGEGHELIEPRHKTELKPVPSPAAPRAAQPAPSVRPTQPSVQTARPVPKPRPTLTPADNNDDLF